MISGADVRAALEQAEIRAQVEIERWVGELKQRAEHENYPEWARRHIDAIISKETRG